MALQSTAHIRITAHRCSACWKCLEVCKAGVFGKVDLPWHKHVFLAAPEQCRGCRACLRQCEHGALTPASGPWGAGVARMNLAGALANLALLVNFLAAAITGLVIQLGFHLGMAAGTSRPSATTTALAPFGPPGFTVAGLDKAAWQSSHKVAITLFALLLIQHAIARRSWFPRLVPRRGRPRRPQLLWLTILMLLVALTGFAPWTLALLGGSPHLRFILMEVHDKLALPLIVLLLLHVAQRVPRFVPRARPRRED